MEVRRGPWRNHRSGVPARLLALLPLFSAVVACGGKGMDAAEAEGRALRFAEAVGGRDTAVLHRLVTEDYVLHAAPLPGGQLRGRGAFLRGIAADTTAWPRGRITVTHLLSDGNQVATFGTFEPGDLPLGSGPAADSTSGVPVAAVHRIVDGRIAETWAVWDAGALDGVRARSDAAARGDGDTSVGARGHGPP